MRGQRTKRESPIDYDDEVVEGENIEDEVNEENVEEEKERYILSKMIFN